MYLRKLTMLCLFCLFLFGCGEKEKIEIDIDRTLAEQIDLDRTIGAFGNISAPSEITVEGFGIVAGLDGRGSSECPPQLREHLTKYIQQMLGNANRFEAMRFLNSTDNAVVHIYGKIRPGATRGDKFDVMVEAIPSSQTTSLSGGSLYTSELMASSRLGIAGARKLATAEGAVFIDWVGTDSPNPRAGRIIGGGRVLETGKMFMELNTPNYPLAGFIRDRINERFGGKTAQALSSEIITITAPDRYAGQHRKFAALVASIYLPETNESMKNRLDALTNALQQPGDAMNAEMGLEALGRLSLANLRPLLSDDDELIRLRAARCMLNIGYENAIADLMRIAYNTGSSRRLDAIAAVREAAVETKSLAPLRKLLSDDDFEVRFAAYEILRAAGDISVSRRLTMAGFAVDTVVSNAKPAVYVYRERFQRIVIFGNDAGISAPLFIRDDVSGTTLNAASGDDEITLIRQIPGRAGIIGPIKSGYSLSSLTHKLTDNIGSLNRQRSGLGIDYSSVALITRKLAEAGALDGEFHLGNAVEITIDSPAGLTGGIE